EPFRKALGGALGHLFDWAQRQGQKGPSNWVDGEIVGDAYYLEISRAGDTQRLQRLSWSEPYGHGGIIVGQENPKEPGGAELALGDIEGQIKAVARNPRPGQPRQFTSQIYAVRGDSSRRTLCIAYESPLNDKSSGVFAVAIDFSRMVANQARHSPRHLLFVTDKDGTFLAHPNPFKVGTRIQDDQGPDGKPRFDFQQVTWGNSGRSDADTDHGRGESQMTLRIDEDLRYLFSRKAYATGLPFRDDAQRAALSKELEQLANQDVRFRYTRPRANSREMAVTGTSPQTINDAQQIIA